MIYLEAWIFLFLPELNFDFLLIDSAEVLTINFCSVEERAVAGGENVSPTEVDEIEETTDEMVTVGVIEETTEELETAGVIEATTETLETVGVIEATTEELEIAGVIEAEGLETALILWSFMSKRDQEETSEEVETAEEVPEEAFVFTEEEYGRYCKGAFKFS